MTKFIILAIVFRGLAMAETPARAVILPPDKFTEKKQPKYMRTNPTRAHTSYFDEKTDEIFSVAAFEDIDISYNGKLWFHLLGNFCSKKLKFLSIEH